MKISVDYHIYSNEHVGFFYFNRGLISNIVLLILNDQYVLKRISEESACVNVCVDVDDIV